MTPRARLVGAVIASAFALALGVLAAWPIYREAWLLVAAGAGLVLGCGIAVLGARRLGGIATAGVLLGAFALTVVPVAVPHALDRLPSGLGRGFVDGIAAIVLGWKQLLTLTLPVGAYQAVMVPAYLVFLLAAFFATRIALRPGRLAPLAALPLVAPVVFGTVFGASAVSPPLMLGALRIAAPRELAIWLAAGALGAAWVWFSAGAERRAALRRGRVPGERGYRRGRLLRAGLGAAVLAVALSAGVVLAPALGADARQVPRDRIDPEVVLRERPSPLTAYRAWKRDATIDAPLFSVISDGALPERLRLAVLDDYDGVDFHIGAAEAGRFTRFPSGEPASEPATVIVRIEEGYRDVWVPTAGLGSVPSFEGPRAAELADAFYVNRATGAAIAVPGGAETEGLVRGDGFRATMRTAPDPVLEGMPVGAGPAVDLEAMPELAAWLDAQEQPATSEGLLELIERLRERGYLSHSIAAEEGERLWLDRLAERYGTRFEPSAGGHSTARIEQLFAQLNTQQRLAGESPSPEMLVAGVGDDEQFAAAAAIVARALGFESRVVLGVRLGGEQVGVPGVPACSELCTGEHLAAWVEVRGAKGEWAPIDVTPQLELRPTTLEEGEQLPEFPTTPEERDAREVDPPIGLGERSDSPEDPAELPAEPWLAPVLRAVGLGVSAMLLLALPLCFLPLAKRLRTRSRSSEEDPELRALAAWREMVDRAVDAGVAIPISASRAEIASLLGTAPSAWAAETADRAVFSAGGITPEDAEWMWAAVAADRAEREAGLSVWQRLRTRYSLRSYGGGIVKRPAHAAESAVPSDERV